MTRNARRWVGGFVAGAFLVLAVVLLVPTQRGLLLHGAPAHDAVVTEVRPAGVDTCKGAVRTRYDVAVEWQRNGRPVRATGSWCAEDPPQVGAAQRVWELTDGHITNSSPRSVRIAIGVVVLIFLGMAALGPRMWPRQRPPLSPEALSRT